jgi:hypothetical protein
MPITYRIDQERGRIVTECSGNVTLPQVRAHFDQLQRDPACPRRLDVLLDLSEETSLPESPHIRAAAERIGQLEDIVFQACAILAPQDAIFGMARVFEVFARGHFADIRTFRNRKDAEEWLDAFWRE